MSGKDRKVGAPSWPTDRDAQVDIFVGGPLGQPVADYVKSTIARHPTTNNINFDHQLIHCSSLLVVDLRPNLADMVIVPIEEAHYIGIHYSYQGCPNIIQLGNITSWSKAFKEAQTFPNGPNGQDVVVLMIETPNESRGPGLDFVFVNPAQLNQLQTAIAGLPVPSGK